MRCKFNDLYPGGLGEYEWPINHDEEDPFGLSLDVQRTATTSGVHFVRQVGDASGLTRSVKGSILERAQLVKFHTYLGVCGGGFGPRRTIVYSDQLGSEFEVLLTAFLPTAKRVASNPRGASADERLVMWTYTMTMDVIRAIADWP